jgi:hypothetical protein
MYINVFRLLYTGVQLNRSFIKGLMVLLASNNLIYHTIEDNGSFNDRLQSNFLVDINDNTYFRFKYSLLQTPILIKN